MSIQDYINSKNFLYKPGNTTERTFYGDFQQLVEIFEQKIKNRIARVWGEDKPNATENLAMAAEPEVDYSTKRKK